MSRFRRIIVLSSDDEDDSSVQEASESSSTSVNSTEDVVKSRKIFQISDDEDDSSVHEANESSSTSVNSSDAVESSKISQISEDGRSVHEANISRSSNSSKDDYEFARLSGIVQSPTEILPKPLARSSALIKPTRMSSVPQETFEVHDDVFVSDDSEVIEASGSDVWQKTPKENNAEMMVIEESNNSTTTSKIGSLKTLSTSTPKSGGSNDFSSTDRTGSSHGYSALATPTASLKIVESDSPAALPFQPVSSTRMLPVPQEMLNQRKSIVLDEDSDDDEWQRAPKLNHAEKIVIQESYDSAASSKNGLFKSSALPASSPKYGESNDSSSADETGSLHSYSASATPRAPLKTVESDSALPFQPTSSTRMLPVPQEMLNQRKSIVLDEDSDDDVRKKTPKQSNLEMIVIDESDDSSSSSKICSLFKSSALLAGSSKSERSYDSASANKTGSLKSFSASGASTASSFSNSSTDSQSERRRLKQQIQDKAFALRSLEHAYKNCDLRKLNDGGELLRKKTECCRLELAALKTRYESLNDGNDDIQFVGSVKQNIIFSTTDQKTSHLGEKGLQTHRVEAALTIDKLMNLHGSLEHMPAEDVEETDPMGLKVELMPHQRKALAWLLHREKQKPAGGILADDMGLGKTLTMIALVMKSAELGRNEEDETPIWQSSASDKKHPGKTLVVCPASLIGQWDSQIKQHVRGSRLTVMMHHGNSREGRGRELSKPDVVITTYGVLAQDGKKKVAAFRVAWERIILDEAHQVRNHKTQASIAVCELEAKCRWCLTGTPFHNKQLDVYSLLKFLRFDPFDDLVVWKRWIDNKSNAGMERLNTVMKSILLRRTKEELKSQGQLSDLPAKSVHNVRVELDKEEFNVYESVMKFSQKLVARYLTERAEAMDGGLTAPRIQKLRSVVQNVEEVKTHEILVLLLRLRQICSLPGLISAMLEEDAAIVDGFDKPDPLVESLFKQVRRLTISEPVPSEKAPSLDVDKVLVTSNPVFDIQRSSSKMKTVLNTIKEILKTGDKVVIVSQWSSFLRHLGDHLKSLPFKIATLDGSVPVKFRGSLVDEFNDPNSKLRLLLLSLTAGGVGLNLIGANHLVIMEPHWNPQLEAQACDRIYRVGQKKPVHIYKVICKETIEEQVEQLQIRKLDMADKVLSGQLKKEIAKLSRQDLASLFNL